MLHTPENRAFYEDCNQHCDYCYTAVVPHPSFLWADFFRGLRRIRTAEDYREVPARQSNPPSLASSSSTSRQNTTPPAPTSTHHTMRCPQVHHLGHHASYTSQLNAVLEHLRWNPELKHLAKMGVDELLHNLDLVPEGA